MTDPSPDPPMAACCAPPSGRAGGVAVARRANEHDIAPAPCQPTRLVTLATPPIGGSGLSRDSHEGGSAVVELVWLGILLLLPLVWIVVSVFTVQKGAFAVSGAARVAGRAYALAADDASGARAAQDAARQALDDQGVHDPVQVVVSCTPYPQDCHAGTSVVTVRISSRVDLPLMPEVLGGGAPSFALNATHTVPIGRYQPIGVQTSP